MVWKYKVNPITISNKVDQVGLVLSIVGGLSALAKFVNAPESFGQLSIKAATSFAGYPVLFGLLWYYGDYEKGDGRMPLADSAFFRCLISFPFTAVFIPVIHTPDMSLLWNRFAPFIATALLLKGCLNRKQYLDEQEQDYGFSANGAIILGNALKDLTISAGAFVAANKLQMCASSVLGSSLSNFTQFYLNLAIGASLFILMERGLQKTSYFEQTQI